jgi:hypothetical protein
VPHAAQIRLLSDPARLTGAIALLLAIWPTAPAAQAQARKTSTKHGVHAAARRHEQRHDSRAHRHRVRRHKHATHPSAPEPTGSGASGGQAGAPPSGSPAAGSPGSTAPGPVVPSGASNSRSAPAVSVSCDLIAAPGGSDLRGNGSAAQPFQSVVKLDRALAPGQTGCLRGGTYGSTSTWHELTHDGTPSGQITITAYPAETATIVGWVDIEASYTTLAGLQIDGSNTFYNKTSTSYCPTPQRVSQALDIAGTGDVFERNDFYQSVPGLRGVGIGVGFWGDADNSTIRFNRIHDVGQCQQFDHLIYLASGEGVQIYDNWLYNDHNGWGITVYPRPTNARIFSNVIDNAGSGLNFGDNGSSSNHGNKAWHNVATDSFRVTGSSGHPLAAALVMCPGLDSLSTGNEVFENDSFANPDGISAVSRTVSAANLSLTGNVTADPRYLDAASGDFEVAADSPVASWELWNGS